MEEVCYCVRLSSKSTQAENGSLLSFMPAVCRVSWPYKSEGSRTELRLSQHLGLDTGLDPTLSHQ